MVRTRTIALVIAGATAFLAPFPAAAQSFDVPLYGLRTFPWTTGRPWELGVGSRAPSPEALRFGTVPAPGAIGQIATAQALLSVGDDVPLPIFADGSPAREDEIFWTAQLWLARFFADDIVRYGGGDHVTARFQGRRLISTSGSINSAAPVPSAATGVQVLVHVVAFRAHDERRAGRPGPPQRRSMGAVKGQYR